MDRGVYAFEDGMRSKKLKKETEIFRKFLLKFYSPPRVKRPRSNSPQQLANFVQGGTSSVNIPSSPKYFTRLDKRLCS